MAKTTSPSPNVTPEALAFVTEAAQLMANLWARWQDEKDYEDINDYVLPFRKLKTAKKVTLGKMTKRPFALHFAVGDREFRLYAARGHVGYTRLK